MEFGLQPKEVIGTVELWQKKNVEIPADCEDVMKYYIMDENKIYFLYRF